MILLGCFLIFSCSNRQKKVLIFSKTEKFRHSSIEKGTLALQKLLQANSIKVDTTENGHYFTEDSLKQYAAVIFLNTSGNVLNNRQQADFERYIQAGGGFVGIHAATTTEYDWPWFNGLVGAYFDGHPAIQDANLTCILKEDQCCQGIPQNWSFNDEWYNFKSINLNIEVIVEIDESSYTGGKNGENHPMVWRHNYDGGRSFYTGLGHKEETYSDPFFLNQLYAGIKYTIGDHALDYSKAKTLRIPEENRFTKRVLDFNLDEPMELDELGDRGIIYVERRGAVLLYDYESKQTVSLDTIDVHYNNEDGLLGLAVDPDYETNNWIYFFYSPDIDEATQYVSRFTLVDDGLTEEKVLLKIPLLRKCCHSGGSLEFGTDGLLYIGVGDNTNPFESSGYAPIDERPGRALYDAQRSAANTNDLRGKILRIRPEADGSYSIPDGNLFETGSKIGRPEIFVMGCRNPFRFSIDSKNQYVYWGDVGPDAGAKDSMRGPAGMGEFNQAKAPGFYGWPYSRGNNQMYHDYDFEREQSGDIFDPSFIINNSPNNTGMQNLPPIQESLIWYSYHKSSEFPWLGVGGVNPMSGPIYHAENYVKTDYSLPEYFENKWFVYEWMRDWIYVVHLNENQQFVQADPFMPNTEFSHPMDMLFSKKGDLYILEYGQKWNSRNLDAKLSVIQYNPGNRPPIANIASDKKVGPAPLIVHFSSSTSIDYDQDPIKYTWSIGDEIISVDSTELDYEFQSPGIYDVVLTAIDAKGEISKAHKKIMVGNAPPKIQIELSNQNTTYWNNKTLDYKVFVTDLEDGNSSEQSFDTSRIKVTFDYIPEGEDLILASIGHQQNATPKGLQLIKSSDCKACHAIKEKVAGPSYEDIARRYDTNDKQTLIHRIIKGSHGIWGETMMAPHPQLHIKDVGEMVDFILSLDPDKQMKEKPLPLQGTLVFDKHTIDQEYGKYVLMASYLDQGHPDVEGSSLSTMEEVTFIAPKIEMEDADDIDKELGVWNSQGRTLVGSIRDGKHIKINQVGFDNLSSISIGAAFNKDYEYYGELEIRKGAKDGPLLGKRTVHYFDKNKEGFKVFEVKLQKSEGLHALYLVFKNDRKEGQYMMNGDWIQLNYDMKEM